ncbi:unnamed protein product [Microthlaspi erraticum]|uniref:Late embryogenesis abundant protein LEA-2 subgroup domain-containing protein n=1 Tax=Microthlaspi erraticum TaxID=1685480 RepID=A0A6D2I0Y4_9BRAS|nr:unnamed protein product [Microthlaspi erraticum]
MEGPRQPPASTSTATANDNQNQPGETSSTWHRPTNSLPHVPSSDPSQVSSPPLHLRKHSLNLFPALSSCSPPHDPTPEIETYVVQVPRDQVYWTPPPENATIAEQRRMNSEPGKKKKRLCSRKLVWFFIAVVVMGFIICGIALIVRFVVFKPKPPFIHVKKLWKSRHLEIMLTSKNTASNMWVTYKGLVSLTYKNKNLGQGDFPELSQAVNGFNTVSLKLDGSKNEDVLPPEAVSLLLTMELNANYGSGLLKRKRKVAVTCDVKVKGLLDVVEIEIVSENCESEFTK